MFGPCPRITGPTDDDFPGCLLALVSCTPDDYYHSRCCVVFCCVKWEPVL